MVCNSQSCIGKNALSSVSKYRRTLSIVELEKKLSKDKPNNLSYTLQGDHLCNKM